MVYLQLLGVMRIERAGVPVTKFESRRALALLAYLAANEHPLARLHLADLFWPEKAEAEARTSLSRLLYHLRSLLPDCLALDRRAVQFRRDSDVQLDVAAFQALVAQDTPVALAEAVTLYRGEFLAGLYLDDCPDFELWVVREREAWQQRVMRTLNTLVTHYQQHCEPVQALIYAERLLALEPWREEAHRQVMLLLAQSGQRSAALAQYATCCRILAAELGVEPAEETVALYRRIGAGEVVGPSKPTQIVAADPPLPPHNLPAPLTELFGRDLELEQLAVRLKRSGCRLLTLVGPGGIGKTRLALELARRVASAFGDGVFLVSLAPLPSPEAIPSTIAQGLGIQEASDQPLLQTLQTWLQPRHLLLVLDNFEHVMAAAPLLMHLLAAAPELKVLVTSREALGLYGEHQFLVPPLALPGRGALPSLERLAQVAAIALFTARLQAVQFDFVLTAENAPVVVEICTRLDGLPLAIELAAVRGREISLTALRAQLAHHLNLPARQPGDRPARHQTLHAAIAWSYDLLAEPEKVLFRRLSVFAGGCTLAAVEAVCNADGALPMAVLDSLRSLVDKSLLVQTPAAMGQQPGEGELRFTMLETIRAYALARLEEQGEEATIRQQHAAYYLALVEAAAHARIAWLERVAAEYDNLRAALVWSQATTASTGDSGGATTLGLRLAGALVWFWIQRGLWHEGRTWLAWALAQATGDAHRQTRATVLLGMGYLLWQQGDTLKGRALLQESLALYRELGDTTGSAAVLKGLGEVARERGDYGTGQPLLEQSLALYRELGDNFGIAWALCSLGELHVQQGNTEQAAALLAESLALFQALDIKHGIAWVLNHCGHVAQLYCDAGRAITLQQESLILFREFGDKVGSAWALCSLGELHVLQGDRAQAACSFIESLALFQELGDPKGIAWCLAGLASVASANGHLEQAAQLWGAAEALRENNGWRPSLGDSGDAERAQAAAMDKQAWTAAWAAGRAMPLAQAIADALSISDHHD